MQAPFIASPQSPGGMTPVVKDRLTVVDLVYHRPAYGGETHACELRFNRDLETFEQVYERKHVRADVEWSRIDLGWITKCGMLVIVNEEGRFQRRNPTDEEATGIKSKVLEVCRGPEPRSDMAWLIPAGESMRVVPPSIDTLWIRGTGGRNQYTVVAFPA